MPEQPDALAPNAGGQESDCAFVADQRTKILEHELQDCKMALVPVADWRRLCDLAEAGVKDTDWLTVMSKAVKERQRKLRIFLAAPSAQAVLARREREQAVIEAGLVWRAVGYVCGTAEHEAVEGAVDALAAQEGE